ncbi:hypothetical protein PITC_032930 [Penicillium italicum]|uniref:RapZ C-terminal domain-containing protein n=1 Tax=Penicillium italicum TaxID=40296 RepID=A0A0A2L6X7_PENIT|nr:hypothetical protein PITC_032930 [Penicillium italicum]
MIIYPVDSSAASAWRPSITVSLYSYGHANGPFVRPEIWEQGSILLSYNIRHLPNPPRNLRAMTTGLSPRLRKEFLNNDKVQSSLERTQSEIVNSLKTTCDALSQENCSVEKTKTHGNESEIMTTGIQQKPNISLVVTVCCEEGRHRSVAFVEELAKRLSFLKDGADMSHTWELSITTSHRDLEALGFAPNGSDTMVSQTVGHSYAKGKREKGKDARRLNQKNRNGYED